MRNLVAIGGTVAEIWRLTVLKMAVVGRLEFLKIRNFNGLSG